jgi:hypothetical protein
MLIWTCFANSAMRFAWIFALPAGWTIMNTKLFLSAPLAAILSLLALNFIWIVDIYICASD